MSRLVIILVVVLLAGGVSACGKKGPLEAPAAGLAGVHEVQPT
jgi:predicted small lipoprotein YifL